MNIPLPQPVSFDHDGETYTLLFNFNALCELEKSTDLPLPVVLDRMARGPRVGDLRECIYAALRHHHADITLEQAGELVLALTIPKAAALMAQTFKAGLLPDKDAEKAKGKLRITEAEPKRARKARAKAA